MPIFHSKCNKTARKDHKSISQSACCKILKEKLELEKKIFERIKNTRL